jgi:hypothetical protein
MRNRHPRRQGRPVFFDDDDPKNTFDDVKERATPQAVHGVEPQSVKGHEYDITDRAGRGKTCHVERGKRKSQNKGRRRGPDRTDYTCRFV